MRKISTAVFIAAVLSVCLHAQSSEPKSVIVPDRFVRGYDPVTIRYADSVGPASGGSASGPSEYLSIDPSVDGEYRWEDSRTIRFLPSVPWPPLKRFTVRAKGDTFVLTSMIAPPQSITPSSGSANLEPFTSFVLTFPAPLGAEELRRMLQIELRDLPGVSPEGALWLRDGEFSVVELESNKSPTRVSYRVTLDKAVPYGKRVLLHVLLSPDPELTDAVAVYSWETKSEFRLVGMGGASTRFPVSAAGAAYSPDQAINCGSGSGQPVYLEFSDQLGSLDLETLKRMVSFTPSVRNLRFSVSGSRINLSFDADRERIYKLDVSPRGAVSSSGRVVSGSARASFYFYYKQAESFVSWKTSEGIMERYGPRRYPMEGRGIGRLDLRIHRIDPESWDFQPFPRSPVAIDENRRPPMSGEEPASGTDLSAQIRLLPSPPVSKIIDLPVTATSPRSTWGLDLGKEMDEAFGKDSAGTYLVGYRTLDKTSTRYWVRVTVTDLSLTASEEERAVQFYATSLKTGEPVSGAEVRLEARKDGKTVRLAEGRTDRSGAFRYEHRSPLLLRPERVVVVKGDDTLVVRTDDPPPSFANNHWYGGQRWLSWLADEPRADREAPRHKGWVTTERPVYRPDEAVHAVGWARDWRLGRIERYTGKDLIGYVVGPDDRTWTIPLALSDGGTVSFDFAEKNIPTGEYQLSLATKDGDILSTAPFKILSYRVPLFEVNLSGADSVPLDKPFDVLLTANYYSGGRVTGEEVSWQIEQLPWSVRASSYPGFAFSTDERFSSGAAFEAAEAGSRQGTLDQDGSARLTLDPRLERDGKARRYVVTGTVRGADRQSVVQTKTVYALPPFSVGVKTERLVKEGRVVTGEVLALDHLEKPLPGKDLSIRLIQRQWHSYVSEADFSTGDAKYVSESVDVVVAEKTIVSGLAPASLSFPVKEGGVYILEVSSRDYLGRRIVASSDLFVASGESQVSWERKTAGLFEMTPDKDSYKSGETARLILKSPYREGYALLVTEAPDRNLYTVVPVREGRGIAEIRIDGTMVPSLQIQALLYRGRVGEVPDPSTPADLGKPATVGSSVVLKVRPTENQLAVTLDHPQKASPGTRITVSLSAADDSGAPVDGEAALWLVDRAVLSLGTERALDPLPAFIDRLKSAVRLSDTRNTAIGYLPVAEVPGGDGADEVFSSELLKRSTVRKNFKTVPYFKAGIPVRGGSASVDIDLPDNLTDFAVRAVVTSGFSRFGAARSVLPIRLDVTLQQIVPRFLRPNDQFVAGATARVTDDKGGPASWTFTLKGLVSRDAPSAADSARRIDLPPRDAVRLLVLLAAPGGLAPSEAGATVEFAIERAADKAGDAFAIDLPVRPDARPRGESASFTVDSKTTAPFPAPSAPYREGTLKRTVTVAQDGRLLAIARGFSFLKEYPHGCLEQRTSQLYPSIAMKGFVESVGLDSPAALLDSAFAEYKRYLASCQDPDTGLLSYWPKSEPSVSLTAYVVEFLTACEKAGYKIDKKAFENAERGLSRSLRSDSYLWDERWADFERVQALAALEAAGRWENSYAGQFIGRIDSMDLYTRARLFTTLKNRKAKGSRVDELEKSLLSSLTIKKERGKDVLAGIKDFRGSGRVLLTETRAVAAALEALSLSNSKDKRIAVLADWLLERAGPEGWGSTIDTVAAVKALSLWLDRQDSEDVILEFSSDGKRDRQRTKGARVATFDLNGYAVGSVRIVRGAEKKPVSVLVSTTYLPDARGGSLPAQNSGFMVEREFLPVASDGALLKAVPAKAGATASFPLDSVVEEHVVLTNFQDRDFVALEVPLAAGFEPLDPRLAGSSAEATPSNALTRAPSYSMSLDDRVVYYYNALPKGTYHFYFRTRASFEGRYTSPQARAELMYDSKVFGLSPGMEVQVTGTQAK